MKRFALSLCLILALSAPSRAAAPQTQPQPRTPAGQDEFVPVEAPVNPGDTIPAPRLVGIAYGFIWVVLFGYVWSVRSRLARVEREMHNLSQRVK